MIIYSADEFKRLLHLAYFYSQEGNLFMKEQVERDIDEMISNRIATNIVA